MKAIEQTSLALLVASLVLLGLVATAAAYLLFARGLAVVPVATAATLSLAEPLSLYRSYRLTLLGGNLHDTFGSALDGAGNGTPGTNYVATVSSRNLVIPSFTPAQFRRFVGTTISVKDLFAATRSSLSHPPRQRPLRFQIAP